MPGSEIRAEKRERQLVISRLLTQHSLDGLPPRARATVQESMHRLYRKGLDAQPEDKEIGRIHLDWRDGIVARTLKRKTLARLSPKTLDDIRNALKMAHLRGFAKKQSVAAAED